MSQQLHRLPSGQGEAIRRQFPIGGRARERELHAGSGETPGPTV